jgi:hypothetical protein
MAMDTSWAAEVRWQDIGIADAADPWRPRSESRSEASWLSTGTAAPAIWMFVLSMGVLLPLLLA